MKILVLSDLHLEFGGFRYPESEGGFPDCDAVVLAGDIDQGLGAFTWINENVPDGLPVAYTAGNHEFHDTDFDQHKIALKKEAEKNPNVHMLDWETNWLCDAHNVMFTGGTLWTNYLLYGIMSETIGKLQAMNVIRDYRMITGISPEILVGEFDKTITHMAVTLAMMDASTKAVVVTHHLPSEESCDKSCGMDVLNTSYASNLEGFIRGNPIHTWIHGHTHVSNDYSIYDTRVVSNPRGYEIDGRTNPNFDPRMVIEV